jgi:uncharacterized protein YdbL (DUF1318 family)
VGNHGDLIFAANRSDDGEDRGIAEGSVDIVRALPSRCAQLAGRKVLDRCEPGQLFQPIHRLFMHRCSHCGRGE